MYNETTKEKAAEHDQFVSDILKNMSKKEREIMKKGN